MRRRGGARFWSSGALDRSSCRRRAGGRQPRSRPAPRRASIPRWLDCSGIILNESAALDNLRRRWDERSSAFCWPLWWPIPSVAARQRRRDRRPCPEQRLRPRVRTAASLPPPRTRGMRTVPAAPGVGRDRPPASARTARAGCRRRQPTASTGPRSSPSRRCGNSRSQTRDGIPAPHESGPPRGQTHSRSENRPVVVVSPPAPPIHG